MKTVVERIDKRFEALGFFIVRYRFVVLLSMLFVTLSLIYHLPQIKIDTSTEGFLHKDDPARIAYDSFREQFGRDEKIIIAIKSDGIFTPSNLQRLRDLHHELASEVPYLNEITSLINARNTQGSADTLLVEELFEKWPANRQAIEKIKKLALNNPLYKNLLISEDGTFTVIVLESNTYSAVGDDESDTFTGFEEETSQEKVFISDAENSALVDKARQIIRKYQDSQFQIYLAGSPAVTAFLKSSMMKDMSKFNLIVILTIIIFLSLLFKRISGVVLPILIVVLSVLATIGLMAWSQTPISTMTQIIPSFLLAVGVGASVHVLAIFYKSLDTDKDKERAIAHTLGHSGFAIVMTSLTTAAGIASFSLSQVATVADLGVFAALGILLVLLLSLLLLPALLAILPLKHRPVVHKDGHHDRMECILRRIAVSSHRHARAIVTGSVLFMLVTIFFAVQISYSHNPLKWFKEDHPVRQATEVIDAELKGSISLEIIVDTNKENGLYDYTVLKQIEALAHYALSLKKAADIQGGHPGYFVGKATSVVDIMKEIHKALNANDPGFYVIPEHADLIAQEILLFENSGSDDLEDFVDSTFSKARVTIKMPWIDAYAYKEVLEKLRTYVSTHFDDSATVTLTGLIPLLTTTISAAIDSSGISYLLAFGVIALMMMLVLGSVRLGLISMIPNLFPIFFVLALMVIFDFPLDMFTMLIGSIVIGLAVDDTVHFMHNFVRYHTRHPDTKESIIHALTGTGRAMLITSIVLSIGFFIYMFASMDNLFAFGLLTGSAIIVALLADFYIAPALLALYFRNFKTKEHL